MALATAKEATQPQPVPKYSCPNSATCSLPYLNEDKTNICGGYPSIYSGKYFRRCRCDVPMILADPALYEKATFQNRHPKPVRI